jgi:hypothetical protein
MALVVGNLYKIQKRFRAADLSRGTGHWVRINPGFYFALLERTPFYHTAHGKMFRYKFISAKSGSIYSIEITATSRYYFEKTKFHAE